MLRPEPGQRRPQLPTLLVHGHQHARRGRHVEDSTHATVDAIVATLLAAKMLEEHVVGHREQERPKAGFTANVLAMLHAGQERALGQILRIGAGPPLEVAEDGAKVSLEELLTGIAIAVAPRVEQLEIRS